MLAIFLYLCKFLYSAYNFVYEAFLLTYLECVFSVYIVRLNHIYPDLQYIIRFTII